MSKLKEYIIRKAAEVRLQLYRDGYWVTKENKVIHVKDIEDGHLLNIHRWLYRHYRKVQLDNSAFYAATPGPRGEMAQYYFEQECDRIWDMTPWDYMKRHPFVPHLMRELEKRGLLEE